MTTSPEKPDKDSDSNSSDSDSSSSGSGSSSSSDSESETEDNKDEAPSGISTLNHLSSGEEATSPTKQFNPNPTRAASRLKETTDTGLIALGTKKRDRRSIEEIQRDLKKAKPSTKPALSTDSRRRVVSPALQPVPENISIPNPNSADFSLKTKGKPTTAMGRLAQKLSGRGGGRGTGKPVVPKTSAKVSTSTPIVTNISRSTAVPSSSKTTPPTSQTTPPATSPIPNELEGPISRARQFLKVCLDPKNNAKVVRTIMKALQRYGDSTDGGLYAEHQPTFCDEFKQPSYLVRAKLSAHLKVSEETLAQIGTDLIKQCDASKMEENIKVADVDIKPAPFLERLFENLKLRVAIQRAMESTKCKGGAHNLLTTGATTNLTDFGIDSVPIWKSAEEECDWTMEKDRALLVGVYIHGFSAWEEILADRNLMLEKQRVLKGSRLKTRAETLIKRLPPPTKSAGTRFERAAERAANKAQSAPSSSPPPAADSIRRDHIQANPNMYGGKQLRLVPQQSVASEDEEGEIRSDESDAEGGGGGGRPYGGKSIRMPQAARADAVPHTLLTTTQLNEKWDPKERLKHLRTTLKKVQKVAAWAQGQKDDDVVLEKVSKYIVEIGAGIDEVVAKEEGVQCDELATCLWTHAATFTPFSAVQFERLYEDMTCDAADTPSTSA
ncbi:Aste57867_13715 [Aphanomyces stellatus]|uniref:Aste57867_13715 protein n=1 Tax=Aphanomyces stellatus TaxID=120398 RepID=A0A485KYS5_9STRA|nr:hypothetical protein As57867_013665 [Aphanomyces stellatus]VFT90548.1 Aste57867_13715 [Aphanomyces stellatus]